MVDAVNNSTGVLGALKALQAATGSLNQAETRIGSGFRVNTASDDPTAFQGSAVMSGEVGALKAVTLSLGRAQSVSDVALAAGQQVSSLLIEMKATAASAMANDLTPDQRASYSAQFEQQRATLIGFIQNASFDDANILNGSKPNGITFVADAEATQTVTLQGRNFLPGGMVITLSSANDLSSPSAAQNAYEQLGDSIANVGTQLTQMAAENKRIQAQTTFVGKLSDALLAGVGNLIDTDEAGDSALIQALQVKQSLSAQAINIANNAPQSLLALFRS
jgi:flagellin